MAGSRSTFPVCSSVQAKDVYFKSLEVSRIPRRLPYARSVDDLLTYFARVNAGNYYSFHNMHAKDTRLFFTQSCVPTENESESAGPDPDSASKFSNIEDEATMPAERPAKGGKGRPRKLKGKAGTKAGSKASKS